LKNAAIYLRRSTDKQERSIPDQRKAIQRYAKENDFKIIREYIDDGISGTETSKREAFIKIMNDVTSSGKDFEYILVYDMTRWGRFIDSEESTYWRVHCKMNGVSVIYTDDDIPESATYGPLISSLKSSASTDHSRRLAVTTIRGHKSNAQHGFWNGGTSPYGYKRMLYDSSGEPIRILEFGERKSINTERVKLVLGNVLEIETVRKIFNLYAYEKMGMISIARYLKDQGIPPPSSCKSRAHNSKGAWGIQIIDRILKNEVYYGALVYGKRKVGKFSAKENLWNDQKPRKHYHDEKNIVLVENIHDPIVPKELFIKVQKVRESKAAFKRGKYWGRAKNSPYLLTGVLVCKSCSHNFSGWSPKINGKKYEYYKDNGKQKKGVHFCDSRSIKRAELDSFVMSCVSERLLSDFWRTNVINRLREKLTFKDNPNVEIDNAQNELIKLKQEMNNLYDTIASIGNNETLIQKLKDRQNKIDRLEKYIEIQKEKVKEPEKIDSVLSKYCEAMLNLEEVLENATNDEKKQLVRQFIHSAVYNKEAQTVELEFYKIPEFEPYALYTQCAPT